MKTTEQLLGDIEALTGDNTKLVAGATIPKDLVTAANAVATLTAENATLKSDKTKLTTDLAAANTSVTTLTTENAALKSEVTALKAEKKTLDEAVAAKVAELGFSDKGGDKNKAKAGDEKLTTTQKVLKAKGIPLDTKVQLGANATMAQADDSAGEE